LIRATIALVVVILGCRVHHLPLSVGQYGLVLLMSGLGYPVLSVLGAPGTSAPFDTPGLAMHHRQWHPNGTRIRTSFTWWRHPSAADTVREWHQMAPTVGVPTVTSSEEQPLGEWSGGISPPGSLRTRREGLPSPGSHRQTFGAGDKTPMGKEGLSVPTDSSQPRPSPSP